MVSRRARTVEYLLPGLVVLAALLYYSLYFRSGFELADEGSAALLSLRILRGERPFTDLTLGYNVLWFYPITAIFALIGPNFVAMKAWFFILATVTAVTGFFTVKKVTHSRWMALAVGLALVLLPGSPYKSYIPLIVVANMWAMAQLACDSPSLRRLAVNAGIGGAVLGLGYLIRVDVGMLLHGVWFGVLFMKGLQPRAIARWSVGAGSFCAAVVLVHAPVCAVASVQGFLHPFLAQYVNTFGMLAGPVMQVVQPPPAPIPSPVSVPGPVVVDEQVRVAQQLARPSGTEVVEAVKWEDQAFAFLTYAPVGSLGLVALALLVRWRTGEGVAAPQRLALALTFAGAPLAAYPQFLLFRPDVPHLSEFMPGCILALGVGAFGLAAARLPRFRLLGSAFLALHLCVYAAWALVTPFTGTIKAREKRTALFEAKNGVSVYLKRREAATYRRIAELVEMHSQPGEYVICYPYFPGINFMTDRPTYEKYLYIDNLQRPAGWYEETVWEMEHYRPAVIILRDWEIHGPGTAFSVWAADVKAYIQEHYRLLDTVGHYDIYAR